MQEVVFELVFQKWIEFCLKETGEGLRIRKKDRDGKVQKCFWEWGECVW